MPTTHIKWLARARQRESELIGKKINRFTVLGLYGSNAGRWVWTCRCECGNFKYLETGDFKVIQSCGCAHRTHHKTFTRAYKAWQSMEQRCYNPNNASYQEYGPRGITVCARWLESFENFYTDMGDPPPKHSLGRIDNDGHYCPENCRWEDIVTQNRNRRVTPLLTWNGITKPLITWAEEVGLHTETVRGRIQRGWTVEDALTKPSKVDRWITRHAAASIIGATVEAP